MANIVGAFFLPHVPLILSEPDAPPREVKDKIYDHFADIGERLATMNVDTVVTIGADHYGLFGPGCIPQCLIGIGDVEGPAEDWLGIERTALSTNQPLARAILDQGQADGIDWAFAKNLRVDHSIMVPHHLTVLQVPGIRTIPVYLNQGVEPAIPSKRARAIGESIRNAVLAWPGNERVAVLGTGGVSHWVGYAQMGRINEEFDRRFLDLFEARDIDAMMALSDAEILEHAGNGGLEIKNWICAMAAVPDGVAEVLAYQPVPQWITGMAFAELREAA